MLKIIKSSDIISDNQPVKIPDVVILKHKVKNNDDRLENLDIDFTKYSEEDLKVLETYFEQRKKQLMTSVNEDIRNLEESAEQIINDAQQKADIIISQADLKAEGMVENAKNIAEDIYADAKINGHADGIKEVYSQVSDGFEKLSADVNQLKGSQDSAYNQVYKQLKFFALEICEKITYQKISEDDTYLCKLVSEKLRNMKEAEWVSVTVSEEMSGLCEKLREIQLAGSIQKNADFAVNDTSLGGVRLESETKICDASIYTQLSNIKKYFETYGEEHYEV